MNSRRAVSHSTFTPASAHNQCRRRCTAWQDSWGHRAASSLTVANRLPMTERTISLVDVWGLTGGPYASCLPIAISGRICRKHSHMQRCIDSLCRLGISGIRRLSPDGAGFNRGSTPQRHLRLGAPDALGTACPGGSWCAAILPAPPASTLRFGDKRRLPAGAVLPERGHQYQPIRAPT